MGSMSIWHWIVVIAVVLLLFGRNKISDLMGDVAQGIKAFKKGMADEDKAADLPKTDPKSIDAAGKDAAATPNANLRGRAETERKIEGSLS
ncbi:MAG: twin-arginine translocase TatA/TatE family subunit [Hyphomicrobiales bacterium]